MFEGFELPMGNERKGNAKESCVNQINYNNMKLSETIIKLYANCMQTISKESTTMLMWKQSNERSKELEDESAIISCVMNRISM